MDEIKISPDSNSDGIRKVVQPMNYSTGSSQKGSLRQIVIFLVVIFFGILSGYFLYNWRSQGTARIAGSDVQIVNTPTEEGVKDASTFRDTATGNIVENDGKITTEGSYVLTRGDASQNVYLTSSVIDLSKYVGKKVQIWGETFSGQKAGWLMDVGRIKIVK